MGQAVKDRSEICPLPPGPLKELSLYSRPNPILVAVSLTLILTTAGLAYYWMRPPPFIPLPLTPHAAIEIDGDADFAATALLEGWPGDGSPENPYLIDGLNIDLSSGERSYCISIENTRVSFTISNCNLTGGIPHPIVGPAWDAVGIYLENVTIGKIVNNICKSNSVGIFLFNSTYNVVANNTCSNNSRGILLKESESNIATNNICNGSFYYGIWLAGSDSNTLSDNICTSNTLSGIYLDAAHSNTLSDNTCNNNFYYGIWLAGSDSNTVENNTCNNNFYYGIWLAGSDSNTVENNTCNSNVFHGIYVEDESEFNTVENNTCLGNTEHDIVDEWLAHGSMCPSSLCGSSQVLE
ncbi:MAG: NosD domain-containing protein [Candidatus Thorarchaeota archaeon]|jgi:parallel beta-helix repeat protein